jgi:hypothetical protein
MFSCCSDLKCMVLLTGEKETNMLLLNQRNDVAVYTNCSDIYGKKNCRKCCKC